MKNNFTKEQFEKLFNLFNGDVFTVYINKAGNIYLKVNNPEYFNAHSNPSNWGGYNWSQRIYGFYNYKHGYIIRSLNSFPGKYGNSIFPLNMTYKSRHTEKYYSPYYSDGRGMDVYNIKYSAFPTFEKAIEYFIYYLKEYYNLEF